MGDPRISSKAAADVEHLPGAGPVHLRQHPPGEVDARTLVTIDIGARSQMCAVGVRLRYQMPAVGVQVDGSIADAHPPHSERLLRRISAAAMPTISSSTSAAKAR